MRCWSRRSIHDAAHAPARRLRRPAARSALDGQRRADHVAAVAELALLAAAAIEEFRGDRFLLALFQGALPRALDPTRGASADALAAELERWLAELRQTPAWRTELELVALVRELCAAGPDA